MTMHRVEEGQRLSEIAANYGISTDEIVRANPTKESVTLASGAQVFASLAAGEDIELPGVLGLGSSPNAFGSSPFGGGGGWAGGSGGFQGSGSFSGFNPPKPAETPWERAAAAPPACTKEGEYYDAIKRMCVSCPERNYYDAIKQMCVPFAKVDFGTWSKVGEEKQQQLLKDQEDAARAAKEAQEATAKEAAATAAAEALKKRNKMLIGAGVVGVVVLGVGGAVWAFKKKK